MAWKSIICLFLCALVIIILYCFTQLCSHYSLRVDRVIEEWIMQKWPTSPFISLFSKFTIMCFINTDGGWWAFFQWIQWKHFQKWFLETKLHQITQGKGNFHILVIYIVIFLKSVILCQNSTLRVHKIRNFDPHSYKVDQNTYFGINFITIYVNDQSEHNFTI